MPARLKPGHKKAAIARLTSINPAIAIQVNLIKCFSLSWGIWTQILAGNTFFVAKPNTATLLLIF